jgi:hypothetical protein
MQHDKLHFTYQLELVQLAQHHNWLAACSPMTTQTMPDSLAWTQ